MIDLEVDDPCCEDKSKSYVKKVSPCNNDPSLVKLLALIFRRTTRRTIVDTLERSSRLLGSSQLNQVGSEKMAGDEEVEEKAQRNVSATVIMTPYAD
jgi:hypothetical protein